MNYDIERRYFIERISDFVQALEEPVTDLHVADDNRVLFRVSGKPFEALAWINEDYDLICITSRTAEMPAARFEEAVNILKSALQIAWDHCVAISPVEDRYDLSMALFVGGFTFEAFEGAVMNLMCAAESIEELIRQPQGGAKKKKK
jgi:hypothetical protein